MDQLLLLNLGSTVCLALLILLTGFLISRFRVQVILQNRRLASLMRNVTLDRTAFELANELLSDTGLEGVSIKTSAEIKVDHYDSDDASVNLTEATGGTTGLYASFVAAHEIGHAVIDKTNRILKFVIDSAAIVMMRRLTLWLALAGIVWVAIGIEELLYAILFGLSVQLVGTLILQLVEALATREGFRLLENRLEVPQAISNHLRRSGRAALLSHLCDVARPLAFIVILLAGDGFIPAFLAFAPAALFALLALALFLYRRTVGSRITSERSYLPI